MVVVVYGWCRGNCCTCYALDSTRPRLVRRLILPQPSLCELFAKDCESERCHALIIVVTKMCRFLRLRNVSTPSKSMLRCAEALKTLIDIISTHNFYLHSVIECHGIGKTANGQTFKGHVIFHEASSAMIVRLRKSLNTTDVFISIVKIAL